MVNIRRMTSLLYIKDLELIIHNIDKYVLILIYIPIVRDDIKVFYRIYKEIHLINNLKAHMLLNNDIINSKKIILNVSQNKTYIGNCGVIIIIINR